MVVSKAVYKVEDKRRYKALKDLYIKGMFYRCGRLIEIDSRVAKYFLDIGNLEEVTKDK